MEIAYETPDVLAPFGSAVTPLVESIIAADLQRFRDYALQQQRSGGSSAA